MRRSIQKPIGSTTAELNPMLHPQWARGRSLPARQVERARVILLAAACRQDPEIAAEMGIGNQKAARWRKRFLKPGLPGLDKEAPRPNADLYSRQGAGSDPQDDPGEAGIR
jgi:hypothetical protein